MNPYVALKELFYIYLYSLDFFLKKVCSRRKYGLIKNLCSLGSCRERKRS